MSELDFENPHYCPVYDKVIDIDLCYETLMCLNRSFKISSVKELNDIESILQVLCKYKIVQKNLFKWTELNSVRFYVIRKISTCQ